MTNLMRFPSLILCLPICLATELMACFIDLAMQKPLAGCPYGFQKQTLSLYSARRMSGIHLHVFVQALNKHKLFFSLFFFNDSVEPNCTELVICKLHAPSDATTTAAANQDVCLASGQRIHLTR